jgi:DNA-binding transcriptional LysR family regulator
MARVEHIDWLETFVAVVDHGGFSAAALAVHRSQSRVSAHVAALESALGVTLFDRRHRPVALTDAGAAYLPHAREVLCALDSGVAEIEAVNGLTRGTVHLGSYPSASAAFLPGVMRRFTERYPCVKVHLSELTTVELADALNCGDVHLALRALTPLQKTQDLACRPLWREHLVAVVPTGHPLATAPEPLPITALADFPLVTIGGQMGQEVRYETDLAFAEADERPRVAWQTDQPQTLANFVRAGLGVGVTNALAMRISDTTGLHVVEVGSLEQGRAVGVFWDPHRYLPPAAKVMLEMLVDTPAPEGTHPLDVRPT